MAKIILQKKGPNIFVAPYSSDSDIIAKWKVGDQLSCEVRKPRNISHHRKFFALLSLTLANLPEGHKLLVNGQEMEIKSVGHLLDLIKMELGYHEMFVTLAGEVVYKPKSISFATMPQIEFNEFYQRSIDVIIEHFLKGTDPDQLAEMVLEFL